MLNMTSNLIQEQHMPTGKISRLAHIGSMATGVMGNMLLEGGKQLVQGKRVTMQDLLLTPKNAQRFADHLAGMRGAAMKVGQLLSMDAGELMPEALSLILSRLRSEGKSMPSNQLIKQLENAWGRGWQSKLKRFNWQPTAAASIGQVHEAMTHDGQRLAIKVQYPGIRTTIDSDVDNLSRLLNLSGVIPKEVDLLPLLEEAKLQLHLEADYRHEAQCLGQYQVHLANDKRFIIPTVHEALSSDSILAMDFVQGQAIESCVHEPQAVRDAIMSSLFELLFKEMFLFKLVQTDPNFANYQYQSSSQRIVLLDFGATRQYGDAISQGYYQLIWAAMHGNQAGVESAAEHIGFFNEHINPQQKAALLELFHLACEPIEQDTPFDFGCSDLATRIKDKGVALSLQLGYWHTPPADALFFHRKLGGLYLLAAKLKASVNLRAIFEQVSTPS
jgi:predicted unusual protein kinase regulating ubiquinone biosynthesis (AarF/ABC1/UbiB family)